MFIKSRQNVEQYKAALKNYQLQIILDESVTVEETWFRFDLKIDISKDNQIFTIEDDMGFYFQSCHGMYEIINNRASSYFMGCEYTPSKDGCVFVGGDQVLSLNKQEFLKFGNFNIGLFREHVKMLEGLRDSKEYSPDFDSFGEKNFRFFTKKYMSGMELLVKEISL